jgi:hypothetical protein
MLIILASNARNLLLKLGDYNCKIKAKAIKFELVISLYVYL